MTWPREFGGHERSSLERYVVIEELLAAGAPVAAHWIADRQSGPSILRFGTEEQQRTILPRIASGDCYFCIGMSEPDSGSDLASVRTRAVRDLEGWRLSGTKLWTSHAHRSHYMITLCRTADVDEDDRHTGLSQFIVDLSSPGVEIRPVPLLTGEPHFNEVVLDEVLVPDSRVLGEIGDGWRQVTSELTYERSGPERFLSTFPLLVEFARRSGDPPSEVGTVALGELTAQLVALRHVSLAVNAALDRQEQPQVEAALVKDQGTRLEQHIVEQIRRARGLGQRDGGSERFRTMMDQAVMHAPGFTLRGGTNEILRGIVARGLGLR